MCEKLGVEVGYSIPNLQSRQGSKSCAFPRHCSFLVFVKPQDNREPNVPKTRNKGIEKLSAKKANTTCNDCQFMSTDKVFN